MPARGRVLKVHRVAHQQITGCNAGDEPDVRDGKNLRRLALALKIPIITTVAGARATTEALKGLKSGPLTQTPLQARLHYMLFSGWQGNLVRRAQSV